MPFLTHRYLEEEPFSKVLFYSVLIHYLVFFALFGNPFFILPPPKQGKGQSAPDHKFSVNLLSLPEGGGGEDAGASLSLHPTKRLDPSVFSGASEGETKTKEELASEAPKTAGSKAPPLPSDADLPSLASGATEQAALPLKKKRVRRMPPSMTGPEDCMLKVVGMVCPGGEVGCIAAYKDFCATLPD